MPVAVLCASASSTACFRVSGSANAGREATERIQLSASMAHTPTPLRLLIGHPWGWKSSVSGENHSGDSCRFKDSERGVGARMEIAQFVISKRSGHWYAEFSAVPTGLWYLSHWLPRTDVRG